MIDVMIIAVLLFVVGLAVYYIYRAKKSGKKCIGCPDSGTCQKNCCSSENKEK